MVSLLPLPEAHSRIQQKHGQDYIEVLPMIDNRSDDRSRLNHPGNGPPEESQKLENRVGFLLGDFIGAVLAASRHRLGVGQSGGREGTCNQLRGSIVHLFGLARFYVVLHKFLRNSRSNIAPFQKQGYGYILRTECSHGSPRGPALTLWSSCLQPKDCHSFMIGRLGLAFPEVPFSFHAKRSSLSFRNPDLASSHPENRAFMLVF